MEEEGKQYREDVFKNYWESIPITRPGSTTEGLQNNGRIFWKKSNIPKRVPKPNRLSDNIGLIWENATHRRVVNR